MTERKHVWHYLALFLVAGVWGFAFVAQRSAMSSLGPFLFTGVRFGAAGAVMVLLCGPRELGTYLREHGREGAILGLLVFLGISCQQAGLVWTGAGKAGFITGLYMVLVPLILAGVFRRRVGLNIWAGVALAAVGLYLLSLSTTLELAFGDALVLCCAGIFALHVVCVSVWGGGRNPLAIAVVQCLICGGLSLVVALVVEPIELRAIALSWREIVYGSVFSVCIGYTLQISSQRFVPAPQAALIMSLEAVFALLGGVLLLQEVLTARQLVGCALMLVGTWVAVK